MLFSGVKFDNRNKTWGTKRNTDAMALSILFFKLIKQLTWLASSLFMTELTMCRHVWTEGQKALDPEDGKADDLV